MHQSTSSIAATLAAIGLTVGLATPAFATPAKMPLPTLPSDVARATTQGVGTPATSIADAILKEGTSSVAPEKVNLWDCTPSAAHPNPVVLIHGMNMTVYTAWSKFGPILADQGYCVFAVNLPKAPDATLSKMTKVAGLDFGGIGDINEATQATGAFISEVLKSTGAKKVNLVGYSEGGTIANLLVHKYDSSAIDKIVTFGGINTGINPLGIQNGNLIYKKEGAAAPIGDIMNWVSPAAAQMMLGSDVINKATEGGDTVSGITYTNIGSKYDEFVLLSTTPPFKQAAVPGATVTNIVLQDGCEKDKSDHLTLPYNVRVYAMVINALAGKTVVTVPCLAAVPMLSTLPASK